MITCIDTRLLILKRLVLVTYPEGLAKLGLLSLEFRGRF